MSEEYERRLTELYRAGAKEEPAAKLDRAILAAARRTTSATSWGAPFALAAVIVLAVSVVILGQDEPELARDDASAEASRPPGAPTFERPAPASPPTELKQAPQASANTAPAQRAATAPASKETALPERTVRAQLELEQERVKSAAERAASKADEPRPKVEASTLPPSSPPAAAPPPPSHMGALSDAPRAKARNEPASSTDAVEQDARRRQQDAMAPLAKQAEQARDLAAAREASVPEQVLPPEQWLQQIEKLLKAGKDAEARASLAEFRKRYPHHPLPEALK